MQQKYCAKASQLEKNGHLRDAERSVSYNYRHLCIYVRTYIHNAVYSKVYIHLCSNTCAVYMLSVEILTKPLICTRIPNNMIT